jgi:hypothetical protein
VSLHVSEPYNKLLLINLRNKYSYESHMK